jgi:toxin ParE1/3/4
VKPERFDPSARTEYLDALRWYRERNIDAAIHFREEVLDAIAVICEFPQRSPLAPGVRRDLKVQRRVLAGFPYSIVYVELDAEILILAVAHARRRPTYWRARLSPK